MLSKHAHVFRENTEKTVKNIAYFQMALGVMNLLGLTELLAYFLNSHELR